MACGGCQKRAEILRRAREDMRNRRPTAAVRKFATVAASMRADASRALRSPLGIRRK